MIYKKLFKIGFYIKNLTSINLSEIIKKIKKLVSITLIYPGSTVHKI